MKAILREGARDLGLELSPAQVEAFCLYVRELRRWNQRMNLTGLREEREIVFNLMLSSLAFSTAFSAPLPIRAIDVGTGAGIPGLPLKIAFPSLQITLVEATRKKASFLRYICASLNLMGVEIIQARAEDLADRPEFRESFDLGLARAVGGREALLKTMAGLVRPGGRVILSARREEEPDPRRGPLRFRERRRVTLPSVGLERHLLIWEREE